MTADGEPIARNPRHDSVTYCRRCTHRTRITLGIKPNYSESPLREVDASASQNLAGGIWNPTPGVAGTARGIRRIRLQVPPDRIWPGHLSPLHPNPSPLAL